MGLELGGSTGEIRLGRRVVARLSSWSKVGPRLDFAIVDGSIDEYWANYAPPTTVALTFVKKRLVYDIDSGDFRAGTLVLKADASGKTPFRVEN